MAGLVRFRGLTEREGRKLHRLVGRGGASTVRLRTAMMLPASVSGNSVPVIARLLQADEGTPRPRSPDQSRALRCYLRWRNQNARHPDVLAAPRRERARVRREKGIRWGGLSMEPAVQAHDAFVSAGRVA